MKNDLLFVLLVFFTWATPSTWLVNSDISDGKLGELSPSGWYTLFCHCGQVAAQISLAWVKIGLTRSISISFLKRLICGLRRC